MRERISLKNKEKHEALTEKQRDSVYMMFFGPYLPEWRDKKGLVDNRDSEIASRLKVNTSLVSHYTELISREHFKRISKIEEVTI